MNLPARTWACAVGWAAHCTLRDRSLKITRLSWLVRYLTPTPPKYQRDHHVGKPARISSYKLVQALSRAGILIPRTALVPRVTVHF